MTGIEVNTSVVQTDLSVNRVGNQIEVRGNTANSDYTITHTTHTDNDIEIDAQGSEKDYSLSFD